MTDESKLRNLLRKVGLQRRQILRMMIQTAVASGATYALLTWMGSPHTSWGVIAALFTIGLSADASYYNAAGRVVGAVLGSVIGIVAVWSGGPVLVSLAVGTALANAIAVVWPSLRYAAVTAAIVALSTEPELGGVVDRVLAILIGTALGAGASFLVWPIFGRQRAVQALRAALADCQELLDRVVEGLAEDDRRAREKAHTRFLGNLETARSRIAETRFRPQLRNGASLRRAVAAVEDLWHATNVLERAITEGRRNVDPQIIGKLEPSVREVQQAARVSLSRIRNGLESSEPPDLHATDLRKAIDRARNATQAAASKSPADLTIRLKGLNAMIFAFDQIERSLVELQSLLGAEEASRNTETGMNPDPAAV